MGIIVGMVMALISAVGGYFDYVPGRGTKWAWIILLAVPFIVWGCSHLARFKGYPSAAAYGLIVFGMFVSGFLFASYSPLTVGFIFVFIELMPIAVLLALPKKARIHY